MGIRVRRRGRGAGALALGLALGLCAQASAAATAPATAPAPAEAAPDGGAGEAAAPQRTAVLTPRADSAFAALRLGLREWLAGRLEAAGVPIAPRAEVDAAMHALAGEGRLIAHGSDVPVLAQRAGAGRVLLVELWLDGGEADLRMHLHAGADGAVLAGASAHGPIGSLPTLAQSALSDLLSGVGLGGRGGTDALPRLADWSALGRAREKLDRGDLAGAWRELQAATGPTAEKLRLEIDARAEDRSIPAAMRSRLANASGKTDNDWLRVRGELAGTPDAQTFLAAADAALARGEPDSAIRLYDRALELDAKNADAALGRAQALADTGKNEEAAAAYESAAALLPDDPAPHQALARMESLPAARRAEHWLRAGELQAKQLDPDTARASFEEAAAADPASGAAAQRGVGLLDERMGKPADAIVALEQARELGAHDAQLLVGLARARAAANDREGAATAYREALAQDAASVDALAGLGAVLGADGKDDEALPQLQKALELVPSDVSARRALAQLRAKRGDATGALALLEGAPSGAPDHARAALLRDVAQLHQQSGDLAGAERSLGQAVALEPDDPPLRAALGAVYDAQGQADRAKAELRLAASLGAERAAPAEAARAEGAKAALQAPKPEARAASSFDSFDALTASFPAENPATGRTLGRVLLLGTREHLGVGGRLRRWLLPHRPDLEAIDLALLEAAVARFPIEETPEIPPDAQSQVRALLDFSSDRETIATVNKLLGADAVFVARLVDEARPDDRPWSPEHRVLEVRLLGGSQSDDVTILANSLRLEGAAGDFEKLNYVALAPWLLILALCVYPFVRGWGSVTVRLEYDRKAAKGFFHVKLSRRAGKVKTEREKDGQSKQKRWQGKTRAWARFTRSMADVETTFRFVPARTWYVTVHGVLTDAKTKDAIGSYVEERQIALARGGEAKLSFDLRPREAPIEVRLFQNEGDAAMVQAVAALRGQTGTQRYLRGGTTLLHSGNGAQRVVVGCQDRVFEQEVLIRDFAPATVSFAVDRDDDAVFTRCPQAVEPYMAGDLAAAAAALERAGQSAVANLLLAEHHRGRGDRAEASRLYEAAGRVQEAAELSSGSGDARSATLFAQAGDYGRAGESYRESGDFAQAAEAFEAAFDYDSAIDCHRRAGSFEKAIELLEKTGRYFEAGQTALELEDGERSIRNLQMVDLRDPDYAEACRMLASMFADRGENDLAAQKLGEAIGAAGGLDGAPLEMLEQLGDVQERAGQLDAALATFEGIRRRDFHWPNAAERIEALRGQLGTSQFETRATLAAPAGAAPAAGGGESRYELLAEIGRGGMGVVYQARDRRLGRIVALKQLPENLRENQTALQLFLREARAAAALNHPNIVTLFDADQENGNYYLTMEFLDGLPLDQILRKRGRLSAKDCARLATQIATGLQYAHERRIVHRDIKTSNLFFTRDRVVKIMDFGLAKMVEEVRRAATVIGGTPYYMAPEQASGENVDHRADLYAFGVTLFELLAGAVPFSEGDITWHHRNTPAPDLRTLVPETPDALAELVLDLMEKDPAARPESAAVANERLTEIAASLG